MERERSLEKARAVAEAHRQAVEEKARREAEERMAAEAEAKRQEAARAAEEAHRAELETERRQAEAEKASAEEQRPADARRAEEERQRLAALPSDEDRTAFVRRIQQVLQKASCYDGALNGRSEDAQKGLDRLMESPRGLRKPGRIELAKATVGDFECWLHSADEIKGEICVPHQPPSPPAPHHPRTPQQGNVLTS